MTVRLMLTCLCDSFFGEVGIATVRALEHAGCAVEFDPAQTCCGQPAFNSGDWSAAKPVAQRTVRLFGLDQKEGDPVVVPSGSCTAMLRHGYGTLGVACESRAYELCEFLVDVLGKPHWGGSVAPRKVGLHRSCHGRMMGARDQQEALLASIEGVELLEFGSQEQCCGFGGSFCLSHPKVSEGIGLEKLRQLQAAGVEQVVSGDMSCLMHLQGLAQRHSLELAFKHVSQILVEAFEK